MHELNNTSAFSATDVSANMQANASANVATNTGALWGGRFEDGPADSLARLSKSTHFDWRLAIYDLKGSIAHTNALLKAKVIGKDDHQAIKSALETMLNDCQKGNLLPKDDDEDVHGALERELISRIGDKVGGKLRAGRSRNDQIATLIRMYMLDEEVFLRAEIIKYLEALTLQARNALTFNSGDAVITPVIMPGRTHLQHAQPVLLSHHLLAHGQAMLRNLERLQDWRKRAKLSPYGAGALAGQSLGLDGLAIAKELGFTGLEPNSIDAVASRDVVSEFAFILTQIAIDISRLAEEIILWNTKEFNYVTLSDSYSTGSSIMPQKKNPDISELARGKAGRILGNFTGLLAVLKAQPLAYNRDLQEDKEPIFDTIDQLHSILPAFSGQIATLEFNYARMQDLAPQGFALATDIAEWLVKNGIAFRTAHEISGACVKMAEERKCELWDLTDAEFEELLPVQNAKNVREVLSAQGSVNSRDTFSGTAPSRVQEQLIAFTKNVNDFR